MTASPDMIDSLRLRITSWNIHKGIGGVDRQYRIERVIETLQHQRPDVLLLQEVAEGMPSTLYHNQLEVLSGALGMSHVAYGREHRFRVGGYGNAIISRYPLTDVQRVDLTIAWRKKRGVICARAHVPVGEHLRSLVLFNVHLGLAGSERAAQMQRFLTCHPFAGLHSHTPIVVGGDMNDLWGTIGDRFLSPVGFARAGRRFNTFPAMLPMRPLDAIYIRGDLRSVHYGPGRGALARSASDHLPLVADLDLGST
ncbi:MAG TPA: endonuclease/exonuclease/phosphatase family protein [Polyangiaceae bacterium]|nr:endonuclease/exonuclease/phosphatase family protein [Polyangiaceae bacterium]